MKTADKVIVFIAVVNVIAAIVLFIDKYKPEYLQTARQEKSELFNPFITSGLENPFKKEEIQHLELFFEQSALKKIDKKRRDAIENLFLFAAPTDYVEAKVKYDDKKYSVVARLKGDMLEHLFGNKWSFRIKVGDGKTIEGMKTFSLQHPKIRNNVMEWVYHKMMADEGVIALRYEFVTVSVNGVYNGIYAMEEHFDKRLIENNHRREGPIIKFDENEFWNAWRSYEITGKKDEDEQLYKDAKIIAYNTKSMEENDPRRENVKKAISLLESFRAGRLKTSQVFDLEKMASYYAVSEVLGAGHGKRWHNVRYYYNPVTTLLEPVAFDGCPGGNINVWNKGKGLFYTFHYDKLNQTICSDPKFFEAFTKKIKKISSRKYSEKFFADNDIHIDKKNRILGKEFSKLGYDKKRNVFSNQEYVEKHLRDYKAVACYHASKENREIDVICENSGRFPVEITMVTLNERKHIPKNAMRMKTKDHALENLAETKIETAKVGPDEEVNIVVEYKVLGDNRRIEKKSQKNLVRYEEIS